MLVCLPPIKMRGHSMYIGTVVDIGFLVVYCILTLSSNIFHDKFTPKLDPHMEQHVNFNMVLNSTYVKYYSK